MQIRRLFLIALSLSMPVRAETGTADLAQARHLFDEATELRAAGKWREAAEKLRAAIAIKETPGLWFHLAHCELQLRHLLEAQNDYDRADALIRGGANAPDVATLLEPAQSDLKERIPTLVVHMQRSPAAGSARDVHLTIDGRSVPPDRYGLPVPLDPGVHRVQVDTNDGKPFAIELQLQEGEDRVVEALPKKAPAPAGVRATGGPAERDRRTATSSGRIGAREAVLIAEGALTIAGLGTGIGFQLRKSATTNAISADQRAIDAHGFAGDSTACSGHGSAAWPGLVPTCRDLEAAIDERRADQIYSVAGFVGAGVGAASLVVTWLFWPAGGSTVAHTSFVPAPGGAFIRGTF